MQCAQCGEFLSNNATGQGRCKRARPALTPGMYRPVTESTPTDAIAAEIGEKNATNDTNMASTTAAAGRPHAIANGDMWCEKEGLSLHRKPMALCHVK